MTIHANTAYDFTQLASTTRRILRNAGIRINASGQCNGLSVTDVDRMLEKVDPISFGGPLRANTAKMAAKLDLARAGIMRKF